MRVMLRKIKFALEIRKSICLSKNTNQIEEFPALSSNELESERKKKHKTY